MVARPRLARCARPLALFVAMVALAVGLASIAPSPAAAQGYSWFGGLFGGGRPTSQQPNYPGYDDGASQSGGVYAPSHRVRRRPHAQAQPQPRQAPREAAVVEKPPPKKNASAFVYVFGDSLGQFLANGLDEALVDRLDVAVVRRARGPSGLVNTDYYDWPKAVDSLLAGKDKIDVAVMMIGSNDHQPITEDGKTYEVGSDDWNAIYKRRVTAIDEAFRKKNIPLIWVGVPIAKNPDFADTMAALNEIYRDAASKAGATYVDTWEAFSDDNGEFAAYGPDINGQTVRLRSADGVLFTRAGARKLAHFVETHVRRDLDGKAPPPVLPTAGAPEAPATGSKAAKPDGKDDAKAESGAAKPIVKPEAGPITNLNQIPAAANGELAAPTAFGGNDGASALVRGESEAAPAGRADDARWPASPPPKSP